MKWEGPEQLRPQLRPLDELRTHPDNPKRGNLAVIAESMERFGQVRVPVITTDGTVVAGNHTFLAAKSLGWTHLAVTVKDFKDAAEAAAYMLADNKIGDLGEYDRAELALQLESLAAQGRWEGTGYEPGDLEHLKSLEAATNLASSDPPTPEQPEVPPPPPALREIVLLFDDEMQHEFAGHVRTLRTRYALEGVTDTVLRAIHDEALAANQG